MNKREYEKKRSDMMTEAEGLVNAGKPEDLRKAKAIMEEVKKLDNDYERTAQENANKQALEEVPKTARLPWLSGTSANFSEGRFYRQGTETAHDKISDNYKMMDYVRESGEFSDSILNKHDALGSVVKGVVTGKWEDLELKNAVTTTSSGVLIPQVLSAQVIDLMRSKSLFTASGVPIYPMSSNNLVISRVKEDPTFKFKQEGAAADESSFELDSVTLKAKTIYGYAYITLEAIKSSRNLDTVVRSVFAQAMANAIDVGFLYGQHNGSDYDTFAPDGIINDRDISTVSSGENASYDDIVKAAGAVRKENGEPTVYAINSSVDEKLELLKDTNGQYLAPPKTVSKLNKIVSNQLKYDMAKGSDGLVFDAQAMAIGMQSDLVIKIIEDTECLKKGLVAFQIYSMVDCKVVKPKAICKITGMK